MLKYIKYININNIKYINIIQPIELNMYIDLKLIKLYVSGRGSSLNKVKQQNFEAIVAE